MDLGSFQIDDTVRFYAGTHVIGGGPTDADALPTFRIYEDSTDTPLLTGSMAKLDDANTTGFYIGTGALTAANGFEEGKSYCVLVRAAVSTVQGQQIHTFQIGEKPNTLSSGISSQGILAAGAAATFTLASGKRGTTEVGDFLWVPGKGARSISAYDSSTGVGSVVPDFSPSAAASDPYVVFKMPRSVPFVSADFADGVFTAAKFPADYIAMILAQAANALGTAGVTATRMGTLDHNIVISGAGPFIATFKDAAGTTLFTRTLTYQQRAAIQAMIP